ncbi:type III-A CRISPR-associated protein Cas10/Csm1 [Desulfohalobiaceae bacterium Ax17]|uniref:type III-A CRISPR-associated protein Cas10/Csm1 n=1 Tax=Desulfovulcanus ferrireducens TaxID=2831190 RepID=UPI00207BA9CD|nr:type III-A CRISPR-associated protein Cas10/Csm1 [Desulfovulcanus ferrireducens]MBT8763264.1 type III-A CRISPR-associated protein Cas10/Csm1 [Desulfovulcanus ferrireducens]
MDEKQMMVVLAGLVHDIGKLGQRAKADRSPEDDELMPFKDGHHSHWHVLYTDYFVRHFLPLPAELEGRRDELAILASIHHKPHEERLDQMCVAVGDRLAAGIDRVKDKITEDFRAARLNCILEEVSLAQNKFFEPGKWRMKLVEFKPEKEAIFSVQRLEEEDKKEDEFGQEYENLYKGFLAELEKMPENLPFKHYLPWLLRIMEKYLWCVPSSSYKTLPDISLYDHCLVTAAVAQALWLYHQDHPEVALTQVDDAKKFILFGGDLSGIQRFIFGVSESGIKGAVRLFRARSFYLQVLTRSITLDFCKQAGLGLVAQVMDAGGKFILLLPNTPRVKKIVADFQTKVDEFFIASFKGELALCLAHLEVSGKDLLLENFASTLDKFNLCLDESKHTRFQSYLKQKGSVLDDGYDLYAWKGECRACEKLPAEKEIDGASVCSLCYEQIKIIGKKLPGARYVVFGRDGFQVFGNINVFINAENEIDLKKADLVLGVKPDTEFGQWWLAGFMPQITGEELKNKDFFKLAKESYPDVKEEDLPGRTKTFGLIALKSCEGEGEDRRGRALLCLLKADVDNLGLVFSLGLKERLSLSRFASLSRMLNVFFAGYLVEKLKQTEKFQDTYVVFAGGDDLFLIGPWHQTIDLALEIRKEFAEFCAGNKDFSLSCGLYLIKPGFPVRRAAPLAEEALEKAKARKDEQGFTVKDAVCLFDEVLTWDELERQVEVGTRLAEMAMDKDSLVSRAFIYRLLKYARDAEVIARWEDSEQKSSFDWRCGLYVSHALYDLARNIMKVKEGKVQNEDEIKYLRELIQVNEGAKGFAKNIVGIQYALCAIRK